MSLDKALQDAVKNVPEAVAAGYIDLDSGMLLGVKTVDSHPSEVIDVLAAATSDLFQGTNVTMIENMFKKMRGVDTDDHHYFQEIIINSDNLVHVFLRAKTNESHVLCVVCRISTNMGMALTKARQAIVECETAV
ncbi:hypothetical protein MNBD_GAMMA06-229 [hydrothermal vent metagenome]|uniref:Roadblock/LAMTOR2 domain-containing protein n=1 Tax=hydrothermal vent metagenome TaxID=652676 RepID=A0A3B0X8C8_9ZZZZ